MTESSISERERWNMPIPGAVYGPLLASSGNLVEWFDFYVYSFCSLYFAHIFFPFRKYTTQLLQTAGVLLPVFLMRPIGGWIFGALLIVGRKLYADFRMHDVFWFTGDSLSAGLCNDRNLGWALLLLLHVYSGDYPSGNTVPAPPI